MATKVTWNLNYNEINDLIKSNKMKIYKSDTFIIDELKWFIKCYTKGFKKNEKKQIILFIHLLGLPSNILNIKVLGNIKCISYNKIHTFIQTFIDDNDCKILGYKLPNEFMYSEYINNKQDLTFELTLNILEYNYKNQTQCNGNISISKNIVYYNIDYSYLNKIIIYQWILKDNELNQLKMDNNIRLNSNIFSNLFYFHCFKTKNNSDNFNMELYLQLYRMPINVYGMEVKILLRIKEINNTEHNSVAVLNLNNNDTIKSLFSFDINTTDVDSLNALTIQTKIKVIKLFDKYNNIIYHNNNNHNKSKILKHIKTKQQPIPSDDDIDIDIIEDNHLMLRQFLTKLKESKNYNLFNI